MLFLFCRDFKAKRKRVLRALLLHFLGVVIVYFFTVVCVVVTQNAVCIFSLVVRVKYSKQWTFSLFVDFSTLCAR